MIEVFKTNVSDCAHANEIVKAIHLKYEYYRANFDLEDCDRILRIVSEVPIESISLKAFLQTLDCRAEILSGEIPLFMDI